MDDLLNEFIAETRDMLGALGGAIVAWEGAPDDRARLDEIFRFVHTVKGNSGFFDLPRITALSHAAEDSLAAVRAGKRRADHALVSAVLAAIDRLGELVHAIETGETLASADDEPLIEALSREEAAPHPEVQHAAAQAAPRAAVRTIRLPVDLLDRMMSGVSDLVLARNALARRLRDSIHDAEVAACFERVSGTIADLRDAITRTRMQRIDNLFSALPRMVRDLGTETGKKVGLEIDGGDVELDREMIEMIRDPLTHIVRNAIDHGIETPEAREAAGKPRTGALRVAARQAGNQIIIEVVDDGRGIDGEALVRKARSVGLLTAEQAEKLSTAQKQALVFSPGLSTAGEVTAISGRGVGMDVVRANIERIGGVVDIDSRLGHGVKLCIRVPLTLTIIPALTVSVNGQCFAIPRSAIDEILRANSGAVSIAQLGEAEIATVRGQRVPLVGLSELLGVDSRVPRDERRLILLKPAGGDVFALLVDAVHDHEELVVKPAAPAVMAAGLYAGTTLADDGRPILLLDPSGIAKCAGVDFDQAEIERRLAAGAEPAEAGARETTLLLFRTLDGARRAVAVGLVERIEDVPVTAIGFSAGKLRLSLGERILPLVGCAAAPETEKLRILRLTDGDTEIAYGFAEVIDIRSLVLELQHAPAPGEVAGAFLVDGATVELIDPYWLFALHADVGADIDAQPVCALPEGDPWVENMLRPMLEGLGYRIARPGDPADVLIALEDQAVPAEANVVRLRAAADGKGGVYRYDRAALLGALAAAKGPKHG
jgi:two-component system chemotaxis sensor kinase CheA